MTIIRVAVPDMTNRIANVATLFQLDVDLSKFGAGAQIVESDISDTEIITRGYIKDGMLKLSVPAPSPYHDWDNTVEQWVGNSERALPVLKAEIDTERIRRNLLPITLNGITLDADLTAQKNLSDKLQEVRERLRMGIPMRAELLVWKDHDNQIHAFSDLQSYHDWLATFTIALAERGTRLYAAAWTHKSNIEALTDIDAILAYDVTANWPV